jgi:hypothetical protein
MAGITQADAETRLAEYMTAEQKVLAGQEYTIGTRSLKRADLETIREGIQYWNGEVQRLSRGGMRIRGGTPT